MLYVDFVLCLDIWYRSENVDLLSNISILMLMLGSAVYNSISFNLPP
jgi:hypothetical protein